MERDDIWRLLESAPGTGTQKWTEWREKCLAVGPPIVSAAIEAISKGPRSLDYGAVNALRFLGYEVRGHGYESEYYFTLKAPGGLKEENIIPINLDFTSKL